MKDWELKLAKDRLKNNTYVVSSAGQAFLCVKVGGDYFVKNDDQTLLTKIDSVYKL